MQGAWVGPLVRELRSYMPCSMAKKINKILKMHISFKKMNVSHVQETHSSHVCCVCECSVMSNSLWSHELQSARLLCPSEFPGKNTGVGRHFLLQGIILTQIESVSTALTVDFLTLVPPWKPLSPKEGYRKKCVHRVVKFTNVKYFNSNRLWLLRVSTAISAHFGWCRMVTSIWGVGSRNLIEDAFCLGFMTDVVFSYLYV